MSRSNIASYAWLSATHSTDISFLARVAREMFEVVRGRKNPSFRFPCNSVCRLTCAPSASEEHGYLQAKVVNIAEHAVQTGLRGCCFLPLCERSRRVLCLPEFVRPGGMLRVQRDCAFGAGETGEGDALPLVKSCGAVATELIGPDVFVSCEVRECEAHIGTRGPRGHQLQEVAERLGGGEKAVDA